MHYSDRLEVYTHKNIQNMINNAEVGADSNGVSSEVSTTIARGPRTTR